MVCKIFVNTNTEEIQKFYNPNDHSFRNFGSLKRKKRHYERTFIL